MDSEPPAWLADADLEAMSGRGTELYDRFQCRSCHEDGEHPKRLGGLAARLGYQAVIDVLVAPQSPMPIYPLSEIERRELAVYLLSQPPEEQDMHEAELSD